jgi:hypothetical protein
MSIQRSVPPQPRLGKRWVSIPRARGQKRRKLTSRQEANLDAHQNGPDDPPRK